VGKESVGTKNFLVFSDCELAIDLEKVVGKILDGGSKFDWGEKKIFEVGSSLKVNNLTIGSDLIGLRDR